MLIQCPSSSADQYRKFTFPAGEIHLVLQDSILEEDSVDIEFNFSCVADVFELLLLAQTLWSNHIIVDELILPYMPFGQADRVNEPGECFSLRLFCLLVNNVVQASKVIVYDPHSDVTPALLNNCHVVPQHKLLFPFVEQIFGHEVAEYDFYLVCPDAGAAKKIHKLNELIHRPTLMCEKNRNVHDGKITGTHVYCDADLHGRDCLIIDDLCIGGRTFIEIAKILRHRGAGRTILLTTNGIYSQGLSVFKGLIDEVWNSRKGRVK